MLRLWSFSVGSNVRILPKLTVILTNRFKST